MSLDNRTCFLVNCRDKLCCQLCQKQPEAAENYHRGFEYHHIHPKSQGGNDTLDNIILLCHDCHQLQHQHRQHDDSALKKTAQNNINLSCKHCGETLDVVMVEMNCGWYRCGQCHTQVHLFDHFYS